MARILGAAVLAAGVAMGPAAVKAASFLFTVEFRFEVDEDNTEGDFSGLELQRNLDPVGPDGSVSGSGEVSFVSEFGGRNLEPESGRPLLGIYRVTGTGMTSPLALGSADFVLPEFEFGLLEFRETFTLFNFPEDDARPDVPVDVVWRMTVEAIGGEWGESAAKLGFSASRFGPGEQRFGRDPLAVTSLSGDGRREAVGSFGFRSVDVLGEPEAVAITVNAGGSARTTAPIPLPAGGWLLLSGLGVLVLARRRAQTSSSSTKRALS